MTRIDALAEEVIRRLAMLTREKKSVDSRKKRRHDGMCR